MHIIMMHDSVQNSGSSKWQKGIDAADIASLLSWRLRLLLSVTVITGDHLHQQASRSFSWASTWPQIIVSISPPRVVGFQSVD